MNPRIDNTTPLVSVVICTRDRPEQIQRAISSVLHNQFESFELLIIDQSHDQQTEVLVQHWANDQRVRYRRSETSGLSNARNQALYEARGDLVLMTDDDCEVPPDWINHLWQVATQQPEIGVVFCNVIAGSEIPQQSYVPVHIKPESFVVHNLHELGQRHEFALGIGAGMGLWREVGLAIGGFDPSLGTGGHFQSNEDTDIGIRMLVHGHYVAFTTQTAVVHHGYRSLEQARWMIRGDMYGFGAMITKMVRGGHWRFLPLVVRQFHQLITKPAWQAIRQRQKPPIWGRLIYLSRGMRDAWLLPFDQQHWLFGSRFR